VVDVRAVVVDDHADFRAAATVLLDARHGFHLVDAVSTAADALRVLATVDVDVVLLDVHLPDIDGRQAAVLIRSRHPGVKVVLCSTMDPRRIGPLPDDPGVIFVPKDELDAAALAVWLEHAT
jgi:DNA-binding NarL/FixJ family response regulator